MIVARAAVIFSHQRLHVDQGNHGLNLSLNTPLFMVGYFYFKSLYLDSFLFYSTSHYNLSTSLSNLLIQPSLPSYSQSYSHTFAVIMSQTSPVNSPATVSPNHSSPSQENPPVDPQSHIITNAVPISTIHPSIASALNIKPHKTSSSKPKSTKKTKTTGSKKPRVKKSRSRYNSDFDMQVFLLANQGSDSLNVGVDAAATSQNVQIDDSTVQIPNAEKGETAVETDKSQSPVPDSPKDDGLDEEAHIVGDVLQSLAKSISQEDATPDASASLAREEADKDAGKDVMASDVEPEQGESQKTAEAHASEEEDDIVVVKSVGSSLAGKTGMGRRLRERKGKEAEVEIEAPKTVKKKKSAPTKSPKKKVVGPSRSSSKVEIPSQQKKKASKRKNASLSDSEYDAAQDAPSITPSPQKRALKKKKTVAAVSDEDAEYDSPSITTSKKKVGGRFVPPNVPDVPIDGVSFHFVDSAKKWKYVFARRIWLERELSAETLAWKEVVELLDDAGLMKTVSGLGNCYAKLVKEFVVNIVEDCDNPLSNEYQKVWVRNKCVEFSPSIINR